MEFLWWGAIMRRARKVAGKTFSLFCTLSSSNFLSLPYISLDFGSKRRVAEMSLWAGLLSPTLKAALAKKRGGQEEGRSAKDRRV